MSFFSKPRFPMSPFGSQAASRSRKTRSRKNNAGRRALLLEGGERLESRLQLSAVVLMPKLDTRSDSGARDGITAVTAPVFSGKVAKGTTAVVAVTSADTGVTAEFLAATTKAGSWRLAVSKSSPLADGRYFVSAIQVAGGERAGQSAPLEIRIASQRPAIASFTFDPESFTATVRFDQPVRGVSLQNFLIRGDGLPGFISLTDNRVKQLGIGISPSSKTGSDTFVITIRNRNLVESGRYTLRFEPGRTTISSVQTGLRASPQIQEITADV